MKSKAQKYCKIKDGVGMNTGVSVIVGDKTPSGYARGEQLFL